MRQSNSTQRFQTHHGSGMSGNFTDTISRPFLKSPARSCIVFSFIFVLLLVGALAWTRFLETTVIPGDSAEKPLQTAKTSNANPPQSSQIQKKPSKQIEIPLNCSAYNLTRSCPSSYPTSFDSEVDPDPPYPSTCPEYFRWIHEDLRPWAHTGITRGMVERAKRTANFRLVILKGKAYVETFEKGFQTRDVFTLWGILQLLRRYPGKMPDLEMMFDCVDWPVVLKSQHSGPNATTPPPLFRYCGNDATLDIVFPDWSYWGWAEINIKPWEHLLKDLKEGNKRKKWLDREPYAYWKGNPTVAETRQDLLKCNVSDKEDWNARLFAQDWAKESQEGYKQSDLASQCIHRYKIYIEGSAWSVSEKYILACDSVSLIVKPHYYDFFMRGLNPVQHYWPIREDDKCRSIKFAVDWGNIHKQKAQNIGKAASEFIQEDIKMDNVYDYMFHLLIAYAKLLRFKPSRSRDAVELCTESMACEAEALAKKFMIDSLVKGPSSTIPCTMPPPYDPPSFHATLRRKENSLKQVESWEKYYWENRNKS
ncbi:O-glucosyltransferase rumi-like [Quillaja saponaria]|uniref:O-glucosyltransferase rumi-like n=1 Tax=Quillaja saponaria TaxID=32244 RepID=A0AAD7M4S0_QUISA|nr:O-glucosyltransferase rumi-like [Quillaja saponaria]